MRFFLGSLVFLVIVGCMQAPVSISFQTPEDTFKTWRQAAERLDLETLLACYASSAQPAIRKDISANSDEGLKSMQKETLETEFTIEKIVYEKHGAYVRVLRKRGAASDIEILNMTKEGEYWKILP